MIISNRIVTELGKTPRASIKIHVNNTRPIRDATMFIQKGYPIVMDIRANSKDCIVRALKSLYYRPRIQMATDTNELNSNDCDSNTKITTKFSMNSSEHERKKAKLQAVVFLSTVTGIGAAIGFGTTLIAARKQDPKYFNEGIVGAKGMTETGASLALRALGWGTIYAITGCSILFYGVWKISGATNLAEFKNTMGSILPTIPRNNPPKSRTEFEGLTDLLTYVSEDWGKETTKESK